MEKQPNDRDISAASERLSSGSNAHEYNHDDTSIILIKTIAALILKHKRLDITSICEHFIIIAASNADKEFIEGVIVQIIKDGTIINKKSPNRYDSFYRKLSTDNDNMNPSQQPSATNNQFRFLSERFKSPQDNIQTPVIDKIKNERQSEDVSKLEAQFSALKSYIMCEISPSVQEIEQISESVNTTLSNLKQNDNRNTVMLQKYQLFTARTTIKGRTCKITNGHSDNSS